MNGRDDTTFGQKVLVLTPVKDAARHLERYIELLERLSYPRSLLSLGFMESDSRDDTFETLLGLEQRLSARCRRVELAKRDFGFRIPAGIPRWAPAYQLLRRSVLARSRNHLLFRALRDEDWVLWIDVDVIQYPANVIETLLATKLDIVQPHCVVEEGGATFDLNAWSQQGTKRMQDFRNADGPVRTRCRRWHDAARARRSASGRPHLSSIPLWASKVHGSARRIPSGGAARSRPRGWVSWQRTWACNAGGCPTWRSYTPDPNGVPEPKRQAGQFRCWDAGRGGFHLDAGALIEARACGSPINHKENPTDVLPLA